MDDETTAATMFGSNGNNCQAKRRSFQSARRWTENSLDEEMAKLFTPPDRDSLRTMVEMSTPEAPTERHHFDESDYKMHRGESFPHIHHPLKLLHSRPSKRHRSNSKPSQSDLENETLSNTAANVSTQEEDWVASSSEGSKVRKVGFYLGDKARDSMDSVMDAEKIHHDSSVPLLAGSPALIASPESDSQFHFPAVDGALGNEGDGVKNEEEIEDEEKETHHKHRHKHHHRHKHNRGAEELTLRQRSGTETEIDNTLHGVPTEVEEAVLLQEGDLNLMASHRFDDPRGMRRHKIQAKSAVSSFIHTDGGVSGTQFNKKIYDHQPHEVFVELDELETTGEEKEWKETARWIKYEEDLEEGSNRWGKPHIASLSFHSLLNLRKCLEQGTVLLDLEEKDLPGIAYRVVEAMVVNDQIKPEDKGAVMRALLLRHKHVADYNRPTFAGLRRNFSSNVSSLSQLNEETRSNHRLSKNLSFTANTEDHHSFMAKVPLMAEDRKNSMDSTVIKMNDVVIKPSNGDSQGIIDQETSNLKRRPSLDNYIMRKIPGGSEATTVLVGGVDFLDAPTIAFIRLAEGTLMPSVLEVPIPIRFMFILLGPINCDLDYHEIGRSIATLMSNRSFHTVAYHATERHDLMRAINEFLDQSIVVAPGNWDSKSFDPTQLSHRKSMQHSLRRRKESQTETEIICVDDKSDDDPLRRSGRLFGGLIREVKNRFPLYLSDIKDAINPQAIASVVFIYFAALSGAVSFGGLLGDKTGSLIGVSETLVATAISGVLFSLLSGQPLMIIGVTGPVLLFDESLYSFCHSNDYDFLTLRFWIGIWVAIITTFFAAFDGSFFLRFITRFTEEILAAVISLIFIYESFVKLFGIYSLHPLTPFVCPVCPTNFSDELVQNFTSTSIPTTYFTTNGTFNSSSEMTTTEATFLPQEEEIRVNEPNTALLSTILMFGTFFIAFFLREFRNGKYLGRTARRALGDFGVPIAIIVMVALDCAIEETYTQKLEVPNGLTPSKPELRGWLINPLGQFGSFQVWLIFGAALPALLLFILLFMEVQICELIINKKERMLRKGTGYHIDILLVSYLNVINGFIGGPWMSAAIVRAISHIMSLTVMSRTHAPGDKPHILEVKEQRVTNFCVSLLVGVSVAMAPILRLIPVPVLFGIFLYMGVVSMIGVQFFERLRLMLMPVKHHPDVVYVRRVTTMKMHLFTLIQLGCLVLLWGVKSTAAAIALPFILLLMIPVRWQLKFFFTPDELAALDGTVNEEKAQEEEERDFYEEAMLPG